MADHAWNHTTLGLVGDVRTKHGMGLAGGSLTVCEDCAVEALHDAKDDRFDSTLIDESLRRVRVENLIVVELVRASITR